ncbi:hypothetical protein ACP3TB_16995 [Rahnella variigena]|uniref:hypothetical protein n=1 Tax=Rahnella variigena TaxID=574964 RepID=UPI003CEF77C9
MKNKISVSNSDFYNMIADGAIAHNATADGRLIPVIILNTIGDDSLLDLIKLQKDSYSGDVTSIWALKRFSKKFATLVLIFHNPVELKLAISFEISKHPQLIDGIIQSRAVYLQPGKPGDKLSHNINAPKILVEIPARTTFDEWDNLLMKTILKRLKQQGINKKELKKSALELISIWRDIWGQRVR